MKAKKASEGQQRPVKIKTSKTFDFITIQCQIINKREYNNEYIKFLKLHFVKKVRIFWKFLAKEQILHIHWYLNFMKQESFHPYISPNWSKDKQLLLVV